MLRAIPAPLTFRMIRPFGITAAEFPKTLKPGDPITGTVTVTNTTDAAQDIKVEIIPQWIAKKFTSTKTGIPAGQTATFTFPDEFVDETGAAASLTMPNTTATLTINEYLPATATTPTDTKTVTIGVQWLYMKLGPLTLWQWLIVGFLGIIVAYAATRKKK